jgi:hypothetical protein
MNDLREKIKSTLAETLELFPALARHAEHTGNPADPGKVRTLEQSVIGTVVRLDGVTDWRVLGKAWLFLEELRRDLMKLKATYCGPHDGMGPTRAG